MLNETNRWGVTCSVRQLIVCKLYRSIVKFTKCDVNQMWILKTSKDLFEYIQSRSLSSCNSIKQFDFSTLYTSISHFKLKNRLRELVQLCIIKKNDQRRYKDLVLGRDRPDLILKKYNTLILPKSYSETDIINMLVFGLIDNIFVMFGGRVFQQMGTNCAPLLADLFLYSYEADFFFFQ
jgi:hypothetical protein